MATSLIPMSLSASPDPAAGLDLGSPVPLAAIPRSLASAASGLGQGLDALAARLAAGAGRAARVIA
jgi:hypothetical protein